MEWRDEGLVIGTRRHGEAAAILEVLTRAHGRHLGLVRNGRSRTMAPALQPGNTLALSWRARLDEHLGVFAAEPLRARAAAALADVTALDGLNWLCALLRLLPERDPHPELYDAAGLVADHLGDAATARALMARLELQMLGELGYGLDLSACAATGAVEELIYVSPKSGRAVSRAAGAPWADRLLALPAFLRGEAGASADAAQIAQAFALTGHFLERDVFGPRGQRIPDGRAAFLRGRPARGEVSGRPDGTLCG